MKVCQFSAVVGEYFAFAADKLFNPLYKRLLAKGFSTTEAIVIIARKLLSADQLGLKLPEWKLHRPRSTQLTGIAVTLSGAATRGKPAR